MKRYIIAALILIILTIASCTAPPADAGTENIGKTTHSETTSSADTSAGSTDTTDETTTAKEASDDITKLVEDAEAFVLQNIYVLRDVLLAFDDPRTGHNYPYPEGTKEVTKEYNGFTTIYYSSNRNYYFIMQGNVPIYINDYEKIQELLKYLFTDEIIDKHFSYEVPCPYIYENGEVYVVMEVGMGYRYWPDFSSVRFDKINDDEIIFKFDVCWMDPSDVKVDDGFVAVKQVNGEWKFTYYFEDNTHSYLNIGTLK